MEGVPTGLLTALITPFSEDESLDCGAVRALVEYVITGGVSGILAGGTTGEGYTLTPLERSRLWRSAVEQSAGRVPVLAGVFAPSCREALRQLCLAHESGCRAAVVLTPHPGPPASTSSSLPSTEDVERFYLELARSTPLPIVLYHHPRRTGLDWPTESVAKLARLAPDKVVGYKEADARPRRVEAVRAAVPPGFRIYAGGPHRWGEFARAGADGVIDEISNALPTECLEAFNGEERKVALISPLADRLHRSTNYIALLKAGMRRLGLPAGLPRRPFDRLEPAEGGDAGADGSAAL